MSLPVPLYTELRCVAPASPLWKWPHSHFDPAQIPQIGSAMPNLVNTLFQDCRQRPLGILVARLLWELAGITDQEVLRLADAFRSRGDGEVNLRFSVRTPWETREVDPLLLDEFLTSAMVVGDGMPLSNAFPEESGEPIGVSITRYLYLAWKDLRSPAGRRIFKPTKVEPEDMVFAFVDGDTTLRLVRVGKPEFDEADWRGFDPIYPVLPFAGFPLAFRRPDGTPFYVPGTEGGSELALTGYAFLGDGRALYPLAGKLEEEGEPVIRIHLEYTPGWQIASGGVYPWSSLGDSVRRALAERFTVIG